LVISESATVTGLVQADHVVIKGRVVGTIKATELLELQPKAKIEGDVAYKALEMHQGAVITGKLRPIGLQTLEEKPTLKLAAKNS
jgi:cytoskeletal protein CcmA (bactofilin family)